MKSLRSEFEKRSVLKFTFEHSKQRKLSFLDVMVEIRDGAFSTSVYHKPTDLGQCLNYKSECPTRYKLSVIKSYLKRAYSISSSWELFQCEVTRMKQVLVNNGFPNHIVDKEVKVVVQNVLTGRPKGESEILKLFYANQMNDKYKTDEKVLKNIITANVKPTNTSSKIELIIYYKNTKTSQMVVKNNLTATNVISIKQELFTNIHAHMTFVKVKLW